jgi:ribosome-associated protein
MNKLKTKLDSYGTLRIVVDESRSQYRNRQIAIERFVQILNSALRSHKQRTASRRTAASIEKRLSEKKTKGQLKKSRRFHEE